MTNNNNNLRDEIIDILKDVYYNNDQADPFEETYADLIIDLFKNTIDQVEQDYKSKLGNWGKQQPMTDMYPKEMDALERVRKEMLKK